MKKSVYVFHCAKCNRMVSREEKDQGVSCPRVKNGKVKGFPMLGIPDYKRAENYPQRAINLPGEPLVSSYKDYQTKMKAAGQVEVGTTSESRYRAKHLKRKPRNMQHEARIKV